MPLRLLQSADLVAHEFQADAGILELRGDWRDHVAEDLIDAVAGLIERDRTTIVVDLRRVTDVNDAVVAALLDVQAASRRFGWQLVLVRPALAAVWRKFPSERMRGLSVFGSGAAALLSIGGARSRLGRLTA